MFDGSCSLLSSRLGSHSQRQSVGPFPIPIPILIPTPVPMPIDAACPKTKPLFAELETNQDRPEQEDVEQQL